MLYQKELYQQQKLSLELLGATLVLCNKIVEQTWLRELWKELSMLKVFQYAQELGKEEGVKIGKEEGQREGLQKALEAILEIRFGTEGLALLPEVRETQDVGHLSILLEWVKRAQSITIVAEMMKKFKAS